MTPYNFDASDTDIILRSSDEKEFNVHQLILSLASPVFQAMLSLPQPLQPPSQILTLDLPEASAILQPFLQYLYPRSPPHITDLAMWEALYTIADKYNVEAVMDPFRDMLVSRFLDSSALRVYALASHWGLEEVAKMASTRTLKINIFKDFPREDAELMGGIACQQLLLLHFNRREAARNLVTSHPLPSTIYESCKCGSPDYSSLIPALSQRVATIPWLTVKQLYEEAALYHYPSHCGNDCRNSFKNMHLCFDLLLKKLSELPKTI